MTSKAISTLYEFGERLNEAKHVSYYKGIIEEAKGSQKAKQLAAQLIPRLYKYFPSLAMETMNAHFDLCEEEELGARFLLGCKLRGRKDRNSFLVHFLSHAALVRFMAGPAVIISLQQLKGFLSINHFTTKTDVVSVM